MSDVDGLEETPSPKHGMPVTPVYSQGTAPLYEIDQSGSTTHAFLHAGIPITTKGTSSSLTIPLYLLIGVLRP